jgi:hypothetical protein
VQGRTRPIDLDRVSPVTRVAAKRPHSRENGGDKADSRPVRLYHAISHDDEGKRAGVERTNVIPG